MKGTMVLKYHEKNERKKGCSHLALYYYFVVLISLTKDLSLVLCYLILYRLSSGKLHNIRRLILRDTVCPGSSDPFYIVSCYIKWVTTSWTHSSLV